MARSRRALRLAADDVTWGVALCLALALHVAAPAQTNDLPVGRIVDDVRCLADGSQGYALYLPSNLTRDRTWSVVIGLHPGARGRAMVEKFQAGAERYGYILAGSNNSRNGPMQPSIDSVAAMAADLSRRFPIDLTRVYLAGMSGGARVALHVAIGSGKIAGVIASSAGYADSVPRRTVPFPISRRPARKTSTISSCAGSTARSRRHIASSSSTAVTRFRPTRSRFRRSSGSKRRRCMTAGARAIPGSSRSSSPKVARMPMRPRSRWSGRDGSTRSRAASRA